MSNSCFQFRQFIIRQDRCAMKVTTDACLFGAWSANEVRSMGSEVRNVLDIGTGTGLLSLMMAQQCNPEITAIEIDEESFDQASENIAASPWAGRIKIFHADARVFDFHKKYDVIISNPPFYENELKSDNAKKNVAHHNEGMLLPELLSIIKRYLKPGGVFFLLLPYKRNDEIRNLFIKNDLLIRQLTFVRQSTNHDFFRIMLKGTFKTALHTEIMIDEISIHNNLPSGSPEYYTPEFINLLQDYYLYL